MQLIKLLLVFNVLHFGYARADYPANCQMKMLSIAYQAYNKVYFAEFTNLFAIDNITFGLEVPSDRPFVTYHSSKYFSESRECNVSIFMKKSEPVLGCPDYEVDELKTDCK